MGVLTAFDKFIQQALKYGFSLWGLPKTGQKTSYRDGDDGNFEKGYPKTPPRFTDNGDGTITDMATGLMWVKEPGACGGAFGSAGNPSTMLWDNAIDNCLALDYAGHKDWRLPNIKELLSIADYGEYGPAIDGTFFPNTPSLRYWSSTTYVHNTANTWSVSFLNGFMSNYAKTFPFNVRPVRLGVPK